MERLIMAFAGMRRNRPGYHSARHRKALRQSNRWLVVLFAGSLAIGLYSGSQAGLIAAKAGLAQILLDKAWQTSKVSLVPVKPWPWADTHPVAKLTVDRLGESHIVLNAENGEAMAFGPANVVLPGASTQEDFSGKANSNLGNGLVVIGGHRDTHLKFIRDLQHGDLISVENMSGQQIDYELESVMIIDTTKEELRADTLADGLLLITCYPFDALTAGGPLRAVVVAKRV